MKGKDNLYRPKIFGSTVVSPRGQVVIPVNARRELGIKSGDTLIACGPPHGQGLILLKADAIEQMVSIVSQRLADFEKLAKDNKPLKVAGG